MKNFKGILVLVAVVMFAYSCNTKTENSDQNDEKQDLTVITGKLENNRDANAYITYNSKTDTVSINENGEFTAEIVLSEPSHIIYVSGANHARIFVYPKTTNSFTANAEDFFNTIEFKGDDAKANNYLAMQNATMVNTDIRSDNFLYSFDYNKFLNSLDELKYELSTTLDNFVLSLEERSDKYSDFVMLEDERINIISGTLLITYYTPIVSSGGSNPALESTIDDLVFSTDLNNPMITQLYEFKSFVQNLLAYKLNQKNKVENTEYNSAAGYANAYFAILDEIFVEKEIVEELYYILMTDFISYYGAESVVDVYAKYKDIATDKQKLSELDKVFAEYNKLAAGQASVNWSFPDATGKVYNLSDFNGKYVYIDVWATWCGPCKAETPHLIALKEKFKGKNVEFIQISVDEQKSDWENYVSKEGLDGIQLFAAGWDNPLCDFFKINGIPRFILIDKDGNIVNPNADRPSGDIETVLNGLEGI